jgi:hypothetical protein
MNKYKNRANTMHNYDKDNRRYYDNYKNNSDEFDGDNENIKYNNRGYMNESENYDSDSYFNLSLKNNHSGKRPGTGQIVRYNNRQRDFNFNHNSNNLRMKNNANDTPHNSKQKVNFNSNDRVNSISRNLSLKQKKPLPRQQSFNNRTLRGNQFVNEPNRPTNDFDETPIRPLKHNPFLEDDTFQNHRQIKPMRPNYKKENFKKATSFDINFDNDDDDDDDNKDYDIEDIEPSKSVQNRLLPVKYDRNHSPIDTSSRQIVNYRSPKEKQEFFNNSSIKTNQLAIPRSKSPIILPQESLQIQLYQCPPKISETLVLVDPSEIPFSVRSLTEKSFEPNLMLMKAPRLNIKRAIESHSSPRIKNLIEMTQEEVDYEILGRSRRSPTRSILQYHF